LHASGAIVHNLPVMNIVPYRDGDKGEAIRQKISRFDKYRKAIFISANAARFCLDWFDQYWPKLPEVVEFYAVGESTAAVLRSRGIEVSVPAADMTSEGLLKLPGLTDVAGLEILLLKGQGGRDTLARELLRRDARLDSCELYGREKSLEHSAEICRLIGDAQIDAILVHSGELLTYLSEILMDIPRSLPIVVPSQRVASLAADLGYLQCIAALNATSQAMVSALQEWYIRHHNS